MKWYQLCPTCPPIHVQNHQHLKVHDQAPMAPAVAELLPLHSDAMSCRHAIQSGEAINATQKHVAYDDNLDPVPTAPVSAGRGSCPLCERQPAAAGREVWRTVADKRHFLQRVPVDRPSMPQYFRALQQT